MADFEHIPMISPEAGFPVTDISYEQKREGDEWIKKVDDMSATERQSYLHQSASRDASAVGNTWRYTQIAGQEMCKAWDRKCHDYDGHTVGGFVISQAFINETGILPNYQTNLSQWIDDMRSAPDFDLEEFGQNVQAGMQRSHPLLFDLFKDMSTKSIGWFDLKTEHEPRYQAGLMLPYMLSTTALMLKQARNTRFTSMSDEKLDLRTVELEQLFSDEKQITTVALVNEWLMRNKYTRNIQKKVRPVLSATANKIQESETFNTIAEKPVTQALVNYLRAQKRK